mmetsp:Transcript_121446/g.259304  ORF Transcript_121446/g.259304 Transcript_121446/m.259304 type:complete len:462 (+) Transcript_121446:58-1443(+)
MAGATQFVDHYELLGSSPDASAAELKRAYHKQLLEFHPDRRPSSAGSVGKKVTQALIEAWQVLQDPAEKRVYDEAWCRHYNGAVATEVSTSTHQAAAAAATAPSWTAHSAAARADESEPETVLEEDEDRSEDEEAAMPLQERANSLLLEGRALYRAGQAAAREGDSSSSKSYRAACAKFSEGIQLAPENDRLWSHRATCHMALGEWQRVLQDACRARDLCPSDPRNWNLCVRALCEEGHQDLAGRLLRLALQTLPGCAELLALQAEISMQSEIKAKAKTKAQGNTSKALSSSHSCPKIPSASCDNGDGGRCSRFVAGVRASAWASSRNSTPRSSQDSSDSSDYRCSSVTRGRAGKAPGLLPKLSPIQRSPTQLCSPASSAASTFVGCTSRSRSPSCGSSSGSSSSASSGLPPCASIPSSRLCTCFVLRRELGNANVLCSFCRMCEAEGLTRGAQKLRPQSQ